MSNEWDDFGRMCQRAGGSMGVGSKDYPPLPAATRQPTPVSIRIDAPVQTSTRAEKFGTGLGILAGIVMALSNGLAALAPMFRGVGSKMTFGGAAMMAVPEIQRIEMDLGLRDNVSSFATDVGQAGAVVGTLGLASELMGFLLGNVLCRLALICLIAFGICTSVTHTVRSRLRGGSGYMATNVSAIYFQGSTALVDIAVVSKDGYWEDQFEASCLLPNASGTPWYFSATSLQEIADGFTTAPGAAQTIHFSVPAMYALHGFVPSHCEVTDRWKNAEVKLGNYLGFDHVYDALQAGQVRNMP